MRFSAVIVAAILTGVAAAPRAAEAAAERWVLRHRPTRGMAELGVFGGVFLPRNHELYDPRRTYEPLRAAGTVLGVRFGFYPLAFLGAEVEGAFSPMRTTEAAQVTVVGLRALAVAQLPYRVAPFVALGIGALGLSGHRLGTDFDPAVTFGGGLKIYVHPLAAIRVDARAHSTASSGFAGGSTRHVEVLLGVSLTLGRKAGGGR
jgi:OOP family OmpA-OmpF porin